MDDVVDDVVDDVWMTWWMTWWTVSLYTDYRFITYKLIRVYVVLSTLTPWGSPYEVILVPTVLMESKGTESSASVVN